jgi:lipoprotein-anchoring transpeptidase ErfK/SrfK
MRDSFHVSGRSLDTALSRRAFLYAATCSLAGCASSAPQYERYTSTDPQRSGEDPRYATVSDHGFQIPALDTANIAPDLLRTEISFPSSMRPGSILINIAARRLYLIESNERAIRYSVGVGREEALDFRGAAYVGRKEEWPRWIPTRSMIERIPRYAAYAGGMPGGLGNPLGARALYLYRGGADTYFRIHGTNEPATIGSAVSSGCIRLFDHDIIDLYDRVQIGATVYVRQRDIAA